MHLPSRETHDRDGVVDTTVISTGRKEIIMFFYLYAIIELLAIFLDSGIIPTASTVYPVSRHIRWRFPSMTDSHLSSGSPQSTQDW